MPMLREYLSFTAIIRAYSRFMNMTPKKAPMQAMKSNLSIFHIMITAFMFTKFVVAAIMIEESTAFGVYLNTGVNNVSTNNTTMDKTMFDAAVSQPAMLFTADREKDPASTSYNITIKVQMERKQKGNCDIYYQDSYNVLGYKKEDQA
ncbi:hypothetical protein Ahy_A10g050798 [Arachis hypogaea]|uniref:Uncharacterized protein n=1 Tax=Arachis hypogaea TaxID=3818 RepID=A0A445BAJ5_ARAHY|nr:hypothetical protein Ahy_A10g050798 [Arachis hypogaea]